MILKIINYNRFLLISDHWPFNFNPAQQTSYHTDIDYLQAQPGADLHNM
jgi:hypothetical protein